MNPRFAYSTNAYTRHTLDDAVRRIGALGFDGVEILADAPHAVPSTFPVPGRDELRRMLDRSRLMVSNINANTSRAIDPGGVDPDGFHPSLIDPDPNLRGEKIWYISACMSLAGEIGADTVSIATGRRPDSLSQDAADKLLLDSLLLILAWAEDRDIRVGIECEPGFHLSGINDLARILRHVNHPLLGANLDIGHCVVEGEDPADVIRFLKGRIWNIHLEDIAGGVHRHLIPGEGEIDFAGVFRALREIDYRRFVTLELYPYADMPDEAGRRGLEFLKSLKA